jgi:hypothetical protein
VEAHTTFQGKEIVLRPKGVGRFFSAAFLGVWLTFWAVGEVVALGALVGGAWSLATGQSPGEGRSPLEVGPALAVGAFLVVWLALWTFGGWAAGREFLKLLFGVDRIRVSPAGLESLHQRGPFRHRERWPRESLLRVYLSGRAGALCLEATSGTRELSSLGDALERREAADLLTQEFGLSREPLVDGRLPEQWKELRSDTGDYVLRTDPRRRARFARCLQGIVAVLLVVSVTTVVHASSDLSFGPIAAMVVAGTAGAAFAAWRLTFQHDEWVLAEGRLTLRRVTPGGSSPKFTATALALRESSDSDGDAWYRVMALSEASAASRFPAERKTTERELWSQSADGTEVRNLARWLAHRCRLPLLDRTTPAANAEDLTAYRQQLMASGRLGRWAARMLPSGPSERT